MNKRFSDSGRVRIETKAFWEAVQERNAARPPVKRAPEGASCGSCKSYKQLRCLLKKKAIKPYNVCGEWKSHEQKSSELPAPQDRG